MTDIRYTSDPARPRDGEIGLAGISVLVTAPLGWTAAQAEVVADEIASRLEMGVQAVVRDIDEKLDVEGVAFTIES